MKMSNRRCLAVVLLLSLAAVPSARALGRGASGPTAAPQQDEKFDFDIPPQALAAAIPSFMHVTDVTVVFTPELVDKKRTTGVFGTFTVEEGLDVLLDGTGLTYTIDSPKRVTIHADSD